MPIRGKFTPMKLIMTMKVGDRGFIPAAKITTTEKFFRVSIETTVAEICDDYFNIGIERIGPGMTAENYNLIFEDNLNQNAHCEIFTLYDYSWEKAKKQEVAEGKEVSTYKAYYLNFPHTFKDIGKFLEETFVISLKIMNNEELAALKEVYMEDEFYDLMKFIDQEIASKKEEK